jgi:phosphatidylglycerophosphate synthase
MYPAALLAEALAHTRCKPEWLVLAGFMCTLAACALLSMAADSAALRWAVVALLGLMVVLDCADGRLARLTGQVRTLGALADLGSDFTHAVLWHGVVWLVLTAQGMAALPAAALCGAGFLAHVYGATLYSYLNFRARNPQADAAQFVAPPPPDAHANTRRVFYTPLAALHKAGWGRVAATLLRLPVYATATATPAAMHGYALNAVGSNAMLAMGVLAADLPLTVYLWAELLFCALMLAHIALNNKKAAA